MKLGKYKRAFSVSELWGPYDCSVKGCRRESFTIYLTKEDDARLVEKSGPDAVIQMCRENIGTVLCDKHAPVAQVDRAV